MTPTPSVERSPWFDEAELFTLRTGNGVVVRVGSWGATLVSVEAPDRNGRVEEILLGFDDAESWKANPPYFGSTVGRYANRIARGAFTLDGIRYTLPRNLGEHHLHGGTPGFSHRPWRGEVLESAGQAEGGGEHGVAVRFHLRSPDGDQGYPGALEVSVTYELTRDGSLRMSYRATTDAATHINLTNHAYINLGGGDARGPSVADHRLHLHASGYTEVDEALIPTGRISPAAGTRLDFTRERPVGHAWAPDGSGEGFDHNFVVDGWDGTLRPAARLHDPDSGRTLEVATSCPGIQLYTPDFGGDPARGGGLYRGRRAVCLETQYFPDSPNRPEFPSTRLDPGEVWEEVTEWRLGVD